MIVQFSAWKYRQNIINFNKELRKLDMKQIDFFKDNLLFANQNLCTYYRVIWSKVKRLHSWIKSVGFMFQEVLLKSKSVKNNLPLPIAHASGFKEYFSDVNLAPPSESLSEIFVITILCLFLYLSFSVVFLICKSFLNFCWVFNVHYVFNYQFFINTSQWVTPTTILLLFLN